MYVRSKYPVIIVDPTWREPSLAGQRIRTIAERLEQLGYPTHATDDVDDGRALIEAHPNLGCLLVAWDPDQPDHVHRLIRAARSHGRGLPVFLIADRAEVRDIDLLVIEQIGEYIWKLEDPTTFVAGRVVGAIERYASSLLPPFFGAMVRFAAEYEYSWHTPGHSGGTAFMKSAIGQEFARFFGDQLFRSDLSVSVSELGSLLRHTGPVGQAEEYAARAFGADRTYFVTNGTSTSNRIVFQSCVIGGDSVLVDRNAHKSVEQAIRLTGGRPTYLLPDCNAYGIIGPIPPNRISSPELAKRIQGHALVETESVPGDAELAVITNSTYDGLCYDVRQVLDRINGGAKRILFDEAWFAYARFHPMYAGRFAMSADIDPDDERAPTIFSTQSTHKMLAALSQASMIHIKSGPRAPVEPDRFNEAYMMHSSTSPQYAIIASNDVSAAMMASAGEVLIQQSLDEAIAFRQMMARLARDLEAKGQWWFTAWQPDVVTTPEGPERFEDADARHLSTSPECWTLAPDAAWHGFEELAPGYCFLDPLKVTLICPGIGPDGTLATDASEPAIPAPLVSAFLDSRGIVVEKTGHYTMLLLFSLGITKGKWGTLVNALFDFKHLYDRDAPLEEVIPEIAATHLRRYEGMTVRELAAQMHRFLDAKSLPAKERSLRDPANHPPQLCTPRDAYRALVRNKSKRIPLDKLAGHVVAVGLVPYPPGIPVIMPGEAAGPVVCDYLQSLEAFDDDFPGFEHEIHGLGTLSDVESQEAGAPGPNRYWVYCIDPDDID